MSDLRAVYGGAFDPPHVGHVAAAVAARDRLDLAQVLLVPAAVPPHRPAPAASPEARLELVREAVRGHERLAASAVELDRSGPSFTLDTLNQIARDAGPAPLLMVGADAFREIETWSRHEELLARFPVAVHSRAGASARDAVARLPARLRPRVSEDPATKIVPPLLLVLDAELPDVSSRVIRRRLRERLPVTGMVPERVEARIAALGLYR